MMMMMMMMDDADIERPALVLLLLLLREQYISDYPARVNTQHPTTNKKLRHAYRAHETPTFFIITTLAGTNYYY